MSPGPEDEVSQDEKRRIIREQAGTFFSHAQSQANELSGGRFGAISPVRVVGSTPTPASQYSAASAAHQTELPPEQPLGFRIDAMPGDEPSADHSAVEQLGAPAGAISSSEKLPPAQDESGDAGAPFSSENEGER
jgi:hypothetical protein